jgi:hypothetical protein
VPAAAAVTARLLARRRAANIAAAAAVTASLVARRRAANIPASAAVTDRRSAATAVVNEWRELQEL